MATRSFAALSPSRIISRERAPTCACLSIRRSMAERRAGEFQTQYLSQALPATTASDGIIAAAPIRHGMPQFHVL